MAVTLSDMMAVGCDLNGIHYENGESFQPSPLYKCMCIAGAIGCSPTFIQKPGGRLGPAPLMSNAPVGLRSGQPSKKHQQDTTYMSGVCSSSKSWWNYKYVKADVSKTGGIYYDPVRASAASEWVFDLTVQLVPVVWELELCRGVCWHCNTESLQGSSFSLEEELPGPDHCLEPMFQNLWLGALSTRQQQQQ